MIVVFGSINVDLVARVDRLPAPGETLAGRSFAMLAGGKGANQALAARRAGASVQLVGCVGRDAFADVALRELAHDGVALDRVDAVETATGVALIHVDDRGENCITVIAGANGRARAAHVPDTMLTPATTLLMQLELPLAEVAMLARRARARGARVVLNAAPASASARDLLDDIDVVIVNEGEAARLAADAGDAWIACRALAAGARNAVVTLGRNGALHATRAVMQHQRATPVDVVDTVGAGDAFTGALVAALDRGDDLARAVREGVAAGSLACLAAGAQRALPARDAIVRHALALPDALE